MKEQINLTQATNIPLLFAFAKPQEVQECENDFILPSYNSYTQTIEINCRTVGTRSLKVSLTKKSGSTPSDKKNEIDDSKTVK